MKSEIKFITKKIFILFLIFSFSFSPIATKEASAWVGIPSSFIKQALESSYDTIMGILTSVVKAAAARALDNLVYGTVGSSSGPLFITDWKQYLHEMPMNTANIFVNELISQSTANRNSGNYEGFGSRQGAVSKYIRPMTDWARKVTSESSVPEITYSGNPYDMFENGNFKDLGLFLSGVNNPWAYDLTMYQAYEAKIEEEKLTQQSKGIAGSGYTGKEKDGKTVTPGALYDKLTANVSEMWNNLWTNTDKPWSAMLGAAASAALSKTLEMGIGAAQQYVLSEVDKQTSKINEKVNPYRGYINTGLGVVESATTPSAGEKARDSRGIIERDLPPLPENGVSYSIPDEGSSPVCDNYVSGPNGVVCAN